MQPWIIHTHVLFYGPCLHLSVYVAGYFCGLKFESVSVNWLRLSVFMSRHVGETSVGEMPLHHSHMAVQLYFTAELSFL